MKPTHETGSSAAAWLFVFAALTFTGCGSDVPAATPSAPLGPAVALAADADGPEIYQARCASCHGQDMRGTERGPSQLSIVYEPNHHGDDAYRSAVRNGVRQHHWDFGDMPAVADITDDQVERVITHIRDLQQELGFE